MPVIFASKPVNSVWQPLQDTTLELRNGCEQLEQSLEDLFHEVDQMRVALTSRMNEVEQERVRLKQRESEMGQQNPTDVDRMARALEERRVTAR